MNFKKFLPVENYTLKTKLSVEEVRNPIANKIEPKKNFRFFAGKNNYSKPYEGKIAGNSFTINRIINYRNSFLPVINGTTGTFVGKTQINIKMQPLIFVLIFMSVWLGIVGIVCLWMIITAFIHIREIGQIFEGGFSPIIFVPFVMFIVGSSITYFGFKFESKKSKEFLADLLEGEEVTT